MQKPSLLQLDKAIHKSSQTKDAKPIGYIAAEDEDSIIVLSSHSREYLIPKSRVRAFYGSHIHLDFPSAKLAIYKG